MGIQVEEGRFYFFYKKKKVKEEVVRLYLTRINTSTQNSKNSFFTKVYNFFPSKAHIALDTKCSLSCDLLKNEKNEIVRKLTSLDFYNTQSKQKLIIPKYIADEIFQYVKGDWMPVGEDLLGPGEKTMCLLTLLKPRAKYPGNKKASKKVQPCLTEKGDKFFNWVLNNPWFIEPLLQDSSYTTIRTEFKNFMLKLKKGDLFDSFVYGCERFQDSHYLRDEMKKLLQFFDCNVKGMDNKEGAEYTFKFRENHLNWGFER